MFLKIINNNLSCMNSTTIYEMDNIEYFSLPLWQVTYNDWEEQIKARKEYAHIISIKKETDRDYLFGRKMDFVRQMNPLPRRATRADYVIYNNGFDALGVKKLINWAYSLQPHWFKKTSEETPVLLYIDRNPIQLEETDIHGTQMPYVYFIRLTHKNPEDDVIIITTMRRVYLQSDNGKTIERLSKGVELDNDKKAELQRNYCTMEYFESYHTKSYDSIAQSLKNNIYFTAPSSTDIAEIEKEIKERTEIKKSYYKVVEEINNKYNPPETWDINKNTEEDKAVDNEKRGE